MGARPREQIWIENDRGRFDRFRRIEVNTDVFGEASAMVEIADDRAWRSLRPMLEPGSAYRIYCNGLIVFTGRVDAHELPVTTDDGIAIQITLRTQMADARVGSADPTVRVTNTSIREFIIGLYARHKFTADDFLFQIDADRDLITGKKAGRAPPVDLEPFKADAAKVQPTETTYDAAKRHLERHHLMHWDAATGRICVGLPSDTQPPFYRFVQRRGVCNFRDARPVRDWSEIPSSIAVYGGGVGKDILRAPVKGEARDVDVSAIPDGGSVHFRRRVNLGIEGAKTLAFANAQARRELMARSRRKAAWEIAVDDWSFWDGQRATPYAIATTADIDIETHAGTVLNGIYLVTGCKKSLDVDSGARCSLSLLAKGLIDPLANT